MKEIPLLKLFLIGLCSITFSIYGYYLALSLLPQQEVIQSISWIQAGVNDLSLRTKPAGDSSAMRSLDLGERLQLLEEEDNWLKVRDSQGNNGWVYRPYVVYSPPGLQ